MKRTLIIVFSFISINAFAQKSDTLMTYSFGDYTKTVAKTGETYKVYRKDSVWIKTTFNAKHAIVKTETFADKKLKTLNGEYEEYNNEKISVKGFYLDNKKTGLWTIFDLDGKPKESKVYQEDKLNGAYTTYWENGATKISGNYSNGKKLGEWKILYENGNLALKEEYDSKNKVTDSAYLAIDGKPVSKADVSTEPFFPGGMKQFYVYLSRNIRYPVEDHRAKTQGKVYLSFTVNKTGTIEDIKIISSPSASLSEEAIRVTQQSPNWIPGTLFGNPIAVSYNININFTLR
jgi:TonB family protein